jgi:hypothetical protein
MSRSTAGRLCVILLLISGAMAPPAGARAASFFVDQSGSGTECTEGAPCATIALALAASRAAPGTGDRIEIGPGLYVERVAIDKAEDAGLTLQGAGRGPDEEATPAGATTIRPAETNNNFVVGVEGPSNVAIESMRVEVPAGIVNTAGIKLGGAAAVARDIDVRSAGDNNTEAIWAAQVPDAQMVNTRVHVPGESRGVAIFGPRAVVLDSDIVTARGQALDTEDTESTLVLGSRLSSEESTIVTDRRTSHVLIESSLLVGGRDGLEAYAGFGETASVRLANDTIDTGEPKVADRFNRAVIARAENGATAAVVLVNSVALEEQEVSGSATQEITCESSIVPPQTVSGLAGTIECGAANGNIDSPPSAVFAPGADWHLAPGSPAIDSGAEVDPISATDLDGDPRIADGNGDGKAVIDRGAYELPAPTLPGSTPPSNAFSFGKLKRNRKKGTARLQVQVPGPGVLVLSGKKVKWATVAADGGGTYQLAIVPKRKLARALQWRESAKTSIAFTPTGGTANSRTRPVKLIRRAGRSR